MDLDKSKSFFFSFFCQMIFCCLKITMAKNSGCHEFQLRQSCPLNHLLACSDTALTILLFDKCIDNFDEESPTLSALQYYRPIMALRISIGKSGKTRNTQQYVVVISSRAPCGIWCYVDSRLRNQAEHSLVLISCDTPIGLCAIANLTNAKCHVLAHYVLTVPVCR